MSLNLTLKIKGESVEQVSSFKYLDTSPNGQNNPTKEIF